ARPRSRRVSSHSLEPGASWQSPAGAGPASAPTFDMGSLTAIVTRLRRTTRRLQDAPEQGSAKDPEHPDVLRPLGTGGCNGLEPVRVPAIHQPLSEAVLLPDQSEERADRVVVAERKDLAATALDQPPGLRISRRRE